MRLSEFLDDIGRPIAYYPQLALCLGSVNAAILLAQLFYWDGKQADGEGGWIYKKQEELTAETGLSRRESVTARKVLAKKKVLAHKLRGVPPLVHYKINRKALDELWDNWQKAPNQNGGKRQIYLAGSAESNRANPPDQDGASGQNSKSVSETTSPETTAETTRDDTHTGDAPPVESLATAPGVGVSKKGSRFKFKQRQEWARYKASLPGSIIRDPEAVARARRDGDDDDEIEEYYSVIKPRLEEIARLEQECAAASSSLFDEGAEQWPEAPPDEERDVRARELWDEVTARLRQLISEQAFGTWLAPLVAIRFEGSSLVLYAPNQIVQDWVATNYFSQIEEALDGVTSGEAVVTIAWHS